MLAVRVWLTRRRSHPSPLQVEAVAVAVAEEAEAHAAERGLMAERKLDPTDSAPEPTGGPTSSSRYAGVCWYCTEWATSITSVRTERAKRTTGPASRRWPRRVRVKIECGS